MIDDKHCRGLALEIASKSPCKKRKVGAVIVDNLGKTLGVASNYSTSGGCCEDAAGATLVDVIHAEAAAIALMKGKTCNYPLTIYTTHAPCTDCRLAIEKAGITNIVVVETFMKFDTDKLRYDLIPASWHEGDAEVLTGGAKRYKPQNWREVDDLGRYIAAMERHFTDIKKALETGDYSLLFDKDTGLHHSKHLRTNAGFILTLTETEELFNENNG